ncbi:MAG: UMP kinase [Candidatus Nealsonbacteria bacterium]|nr:UMP kinase [Candidatus Nealsonbacteria bacterium]
MFSKAAICANLKKMAKIQKTIIISLGGSIIIPDKIQTEFLKRFKEFILKFIKQGYTFIIVTGGGNICREYQKAAAQISQLTDEDKDWLGIHATRLNAHLLRTIFKKEAYPVVLDSPHKEMNGAKFNLFIASGWRPGWSTDYDAVLLAKRFKTNKLINASNIIHVYDENKKSIKKISWKNYRKLISSKWQPGMNVPFDPIAAKAAQEFKMEVIVTKGTDLKNLANIIQGKKFNGTIIHP